MEREKKLYNTKLMRITMFTIFIQQISDKLLLIDKKDNVNGELRLKLVTNLLSRICCENILDV